jgi:hypothetical protein
MGFVFVLFMTHSVGNLLLLWWAVATLAEGKSARVEKCVCFYLWCSAGVTKLWPVAGKGQGKGIFWMLAAKNSSFRIHSCSAGQDIYHFLWSPVLLTHSLEAPPFPVHINSFHILLIYFFKYHCNAFYIFSCVLSVLSILSCLICGSSSLCIFLHYSVTRCSEIQMLSSASIVKMLNLSYCYVSWHNLTLTVAYRILCTLLKFNLSFICSCKMSPSRLEDYLFIIIVYLMTRSL